MSSELHVVTGAFGYSGRWIAKQLLSEGKQVRTLTNAAARDDPFEGAVEVHRLNFRLRIIGRVSERRRCTLQYILGALQR